MNWRNLRVGITCLIICTALTSVDCIINWRYADWATGIVILLCVISFGLGFAGCVHVAGWFVATWRD